MRAPIGARRILAEQREHERRVLGEFESALAYAQSALTEPRQLVDENGVEFAEGQAVVTLTELWRREPRVSMMVAGAQGVIASIGEENVAVIFEGNPMPYWLRRNRMKVVLRVVREGTAA